MSGDDQPVESVWQMALENRQQAGRRRRRPPPRDEQLPASGVDGPLDDDQGGVNEDQPQSEPLQETLGEAAHATTLGADESDQSVIIRSMDYNGLVQEDMKGHKTAVGYVRVSTDEQYLSVEDQRARIEAWCVAYGYELIDFYEDVDVSGGVPLKKRPAGAEVDALLRLKKPAVDALIVTSLDRLTRHSGDGLGVVEHLTPKRRRTQSAVNLVSLAEHIDLSTAFGRFAAKLRFQIADFEREIIGERTSNALGHKAKSGKVYGAIPYGWDRDGDELVENGVEQTGLKVMRSLRDAGFSYGAIAKRLNEDRVPTKRGGPWRSMTVYQILNDPKKEIAS